MSTENLTPEQQEFLNKCELEFSNRYTTGDAEYKKIYFDGIPDPPIISPWYGRQRNRNWGHGSRNYRDNYDSNFREYKKRQHNY